MDTTLPAPVRTRFAALRGPAEASDRVTRLARALALPSPSQATPAPGAGEAVIALFDGPAQGEDAALWQPPVAAWMEPSAKPDDPATVGRLIAGAGSADLYVNLSTATAHDLQLAAKLLAALTARCVLADERRDDLELALHEAVSNALVHGNLGVDGMRELSALELERFSRELEERLADPALAARRIEISIRIENQDAEGGNGNAVALVEVTDEGDGFVPGPRRGHGASEGASGRGLELIGTIAESLELADGGRRIRMRFRL